MTYWSKFAIFHTDLHSMSTSGGSHRNTVVIFGMENQNGGLPDREKSSKNKVLLYRFQREP